MNLPVFVAVLFFLLLLDWYTYVDIRVFWQQCLAHVFSGTHVSVSVSNEIKISLLA
jgi:hypothetical protein